MYGGDKMPVIHNKEKLEKLLKDNNINPKDAVARGKFYREYFDWDLLSEEYKQGKSIRNISKITGLSYDVIRKNLLDKLGHLRDFTVKDKSKYRFKCDLFFPKLTKQGAYFLGWMYSDGCLTHNKITITLQHKDACHVKYLASLVSDKPTRTVKNGESFDFYGVSLTAKFNSIYNLHPNKSHLNFNIPVDKFEKEVVPYLLLGLLEGDGNISKNDLSCSLLLSSNSWKAIRNYLNKEVNFKYTKIRALNRYGLIQISFRGLSYFSLLKYIYFNTSGVQPLQRKKNLFVQQIKRSMNGRTSPYKKLAVKLWDSLNCNTN